MDAYQILSLPRRAALSEEALHQAYVARSKVVHPDQGGSDALAAETNAAYEILRVPEKRLKHLLELGAPEDAKAWRTVPMDEGMMGLFLELGKALEVSAKFLDRKSKAQSALAKALLANEEMQHREALERIGFEIEKHRVDLETSLPSLDAALSADNIAVWKDVAFSQARFAYLGKWQTQVRERLLALM